MKNNNLIGSESVIEVSVSFFTSLSLSLTSCIKYKAQYTEINRGDNRQEFHIVELLGGEGFLLQGDQ